ncbi:MAG: hypothetical protein RIR11_898 [Bacteroidota bacterium]|jgi:hypothetical protein
MKKFIYSAFAVALLSMAPACNFLDYDLNVDPNNPSDAGMPQLLPTAEVAYAYHLGGDMGRYISIWTQYHMGADRQHLAYDAYRMTESDVNNLWNGLYGNVLSNLKFITEKAAEGRSPHYGGVAKVLIALNVAQMVDMWDDIPYSQALQYDKNIQPAFDKGSDLYPQMIALLDEAIKDLQEPSSVLSPKSDDFVYAGNLTKWTKLARSAKARLQLRFTKANSSSYATVLSTLDAGALADNSDNAGIVFGDGATSANPWFQFGDQRTGDVVMGGYLVNLLKSLNDPRLPVFAALKNGDYTGATAGVPAEGVAASGFGTFFGSVNSPVYYLTYPEVKFIEAECAFQTGNKLRAATAFNDGVKASLDMFGTPSTTYTDANASETETSITLEKIMTQKYLALYTSPEAYNDWRRTGLPNWPLSVGQTQMPRRWPLAQDERVYNNANAQPYLNKTVFDRVFWDVQ